MALDNHGLAGLVADAQRGDRRAVDRIVRDNQSWVRSVIYGVTGRRDLVDDISQQVWLLVWERIGSLQDPRRLRSWLYAIAHNAAVDFVIAEKRRPRPADVDEHSTHAGRRAPENPASLVVKDEVQRELLRAIEALPAIYREPFVLRHMENWSYAQIGEALGLIEETVETRLVRARRFLREALAGKV